MPPWHSQRGVFCEAFIMRYGTIDVYSALENGIETQPLLKSQGDPKSIYVHLYARINIYRYVFKHADTAMNHGSCWLQRGYVLYEPNKKQDETG